MEYCSGGDLKEYYTTPDFSKLEFIRVSE